MSKMESVVKAPQVKTLPPVWAGSKKVRFEVPNEMSKNNEDVKLTIKGSIMEKAKVKSAKAKPEVKKKEIKPKAPKAEMIDMYELGKYLKTAYRDGKTLEFDSAFKTEEEAEAKKNELGAGIVIIHHPKAYVVRRDITPKKANGKKNKKNEVKTPEPETKLEA